MLKNVRWTTPGEGRLVAYGRPWVARALGMQARRSRWSAQAVDNGQERVGEAPPTEGRRSRPHGHVRWERGGLLYEKRMVPGESYVHRPDECGGGRRRDGR